LIKSPHDTVCIDFLSPAMQYRCRRGGGRRQLLARAVGLHKKKNVTICDISAGLGRDAFILAALGARVLMIERSPVIGPLLQAAWQRAQQEPWIRALDWRCLIADSRDYLQQLSPSEYPQVIYFDPMFPERKKSALVKQEMRILRTIVGDDSDAADSLNLALKIALDRVVVKRPRLAAPLPGIAPDLTMEGQSSRFDVYLCQGAGGGGGV
jgi:16S rRNA (guanine1516-N2)-methyltransferase